MAPTVVQGLRFARHDDLAEGPKASTGSSSGVFMASRPPLRKRQEVAVGVEPLPVPAVLGPDLGRAVVEVIELDGPSASPGEALEPSPGRRPWSR